MASSPAIVRQPAATDVETGREAAPTGRRRSKAAALIDQVIDAGMACVTSVGLDGTTIDDIVRVSGIPRTTIYRKLGGRDAILREVLARMSIPYNTRCAAIAEGPGELRDRLADIIVLSIASQAEYPWLKPMIRGGLSQSSFAVFEDVSRSPNAVMRGVLAQMMATGSWPKRLSVDAVMHWLLHQVLMLGSEDFKSTRELQHYVRVLIMPIFTLPDPGSARSLEDDAPRRTAARAVRSKLAEPVAATATGAGKSHRQPRLRSASGLG